MQRLLFRGAFYQQFSSSCQPSNLSRRRSYSTTSPGGIGAPPGEGERAAPTVSVSPVTLLEPEAPLLPDELTTGSPIDQPLDDAYQYYSAMEAIAPKRVPGTVQTPTGMARYRIDVQYKGTQYYGWQRRKMKGTLPTVQEAVEDSLSVSLNTDHVEAVASALTETGAHARRLTCHVDIPTSLEIPSARLVLQRCRTWLQQRGDNVAILSFLKAGETFHAHYCATARVYVYRILNRIAPPLLEPGLQWHFDRNLNVARMEEAALRLQGEHDFGGFADHRCSRAIKQHGSAYTIRRLDSIKVVRQGDEVLVWLVGKSFLRHQIRNIVAMLQMVGTGAWSLEDLDAIVSRGFVPGRNQNALRPPPAPVHGLSLWEVLYEDGAFVAPAEHVTD